MQNQAAPAFKTWAQKIKIKAPNHPELLEGGESEDARPQARRPGQASAASKTTGLH